MNGWYDASVRTGSLVWFDSTRLGLGLKNGWDGMGWCLPRDEKECSWGAEEPRRG